MKFETYNRIAIAGLTIAVAGFVHSVWSESDVGLRVAVSGVALTVASWLARRLEYGA